MISNTKYITNLVFVGLIVGLTMIGCKKKPIVPIPSDFEGETVFKVDGKLDNNSLSIEAGKEDFYMYTDYELNGENLMEFTGEFQKNEKCEGICNEKLKISPQ